MIVALIIVPPARLYLPTALLALLLIFITIAHVYLLALLDTSRTLRCVRFVYLHVLLAPVHLFVSAVSLITTTTISPASMLLPVQQEPFPMQLLTIATSARTTAPLARYFPAIVPLAARHFSFTMIVVSAHAQLACSKMALSVKRVLLLA